MRKPNLPILFVIDDDDGVRLSLKHLLEHEGFLVFTAEHGVEAIAKLKILKKATLPDVIITDIQMPHDGKRFIEAIEGMEDLKHIPIIPMTGGDISMISQKKVMPKPLMIDEVLRRVREAILKKLAD